MDLPPILSFRKPTEVTTSSTNSAEKMRFPITRNIGANVDGFNRTDGCSERHGGASFDARDREPLGDISHVEDITCDEGVLDEKPKCSPQQESRCFGIMEAL